MRLLVAILLAVSLLPGAALAQQGSKPAPSNCMPNMVMPGCPAPTGESGAANSETAAPSTFVDEIVRHETSGTSAEPDSTPVPMLMKMTHGWMLMFHANVFLTDIQQTGARGGDKLFSTNWLMGMAQRRAGSKGIFTLRAMLSLEPATITDRRYPLLFQQGETAYGDPIADGQHPHNFVMEVAALYDWKLGADTLLSFYAAPVGEPAIGPTAFPHRAAAMEDPLAPLGHHQEDSTHISDDVVTAGLTHGIARIEASGFHGREPGEDRWAIDQGKIDSWSTRLTLQPGHNWSGQYSYARIASPEALFPDENQERMTASVMYNRPLHDGNWASMAGWGRTRSLPGNEIFDSYILESTLRFRVRNHVWTRIENAERSNELLLGENPLPANFQEEPIGHVQAYSEGYDRDIDLVPHLASAIGAQFTLYTAGNALAPIYGAHPVGVCLFIRLRPFSNRER